MLNERRFTIHEAIRYALPAHDHAEALWERATATYRQALRDVAGLLTALTPRPVCPTGEAADSLWFWFGPAAWRTLVSNRSPRSTDLLRRPCRRYVEVPQ